MKSFLVVVGVIVAILGLAWLVQGNSFFLYKVFAPAQEQVRREVFEQSMAYNDGMAKELDAMHFEYIQAKPEHQAALASVILHRVAGYDVEKLPVELRSFIRDLRSERGVR